MAYEFEVGQTLSRRELWSGGSGRFGEEDIRLPDGRRLALGVLQHPGACAVVPVLDDGQVVLLRQYRHAVRKTLWEVPAGKLDPGEDLTACALRELKEETGYRAQKLVSLGSICMTPGYSDERIHLYLARELTEGAADLAEDEQIVRVSMPFENALRMAEDGEIDDAKTALALLRARYALQHGA